MALPETLLTPLVTGGLSPLGLMVFAQGVNLDVPGLVFRVVLALAFTAGAMLVITSVLKKLGLGTGEPARTDGSQPARNTRRDQRGRIAQTPKGRRTGREAGWLSWGAKASQTGARDLADPLGEDSAETAWDDVYSADDDAPAGYAVDDDMADAYADYEAYGDRADDPVSAGLLPDGLLPDGYGDEDAAITLPNLAIDAIVPIDDQRKLVSVTAHGHRLLLGVTEHGITLLHHLDGPETSPGPVPTLHELEGEREPLDLDAVRATQLRQRRAD